MLVWHIITLNKKENEMKTNIKHLLQNNTSKQYIQFVTQNKIIKYIFFGVLSTLVNFSIFIVLKDSMHVPSFIANVISVTCAILFAYVVNAKYVFQSQTIGLLPTLKELMTFVSARLMTMVIEIFGVGFLAALLTIDDTFSKVIINVIVLLLNYVFSKLIFKQK